MKIKLSFGGRWAKLLDDSIFLFNGVEENFYEFESPNIALKAWKDILNRYSNKPTYLGTKKRMYPDEIATDICENNEYIKYLTAWT